MIISKKIKIIIYCVFMFVFSFYLIFANNIIAAFSNQIIPEKIDITKLTITHNAYKSIDFLKTYNNTFQEFACNGWVFSETEEDNSHKFIKVVLRGKNQSYIADTSITSRELQQAFPKLKIKNKNHGFGTKFSTITMEPGIYELMIYVWENEKTSGLARSGLKIEVYNSRFNQYFPSQIKNIKDAIPSEKIRFSITSIPNKDQKTVLLRGWGFIEDISTQFQNVFVEITTQEGELVTFDTVSYDRPDTSEYYKNRLYFYCGFEVTIPAEILENSNQYVVNIIIENEGQKLRTENPIILKTD